MWGNTDNRKFDCYVPRVLLRWLVTAPEESVATPEGTVVFVDLSGFTRLSERLSRKGREGAEHLVDTISSCFSTLLSDAYDNGGSLLKFGGDALLLWFDGDDHPLRACTSAVAMRRTLRRIGRIRAGASSVVLRMSVGIHSGSYEMFLVGVSHRELLIAGPAVSTVVEIEAAASPGQILVSEHTARLLPDRWLGARCGPGVLLARAPSSPQWKGEPALVRPPDDAVAACLSTAVRAHLITAPAAPEHRAATVAFLQYGGLDRLIRDRGAAVAAEAVAELVRIAQEAADRYEVCFLASDVAADGGKLLFSAGAPRTAGDDEERMLLAMRQIVEASPQLPVRIGVSRGYTFTGEVGPRYRRTYAVMGDVVNLAARLTAKASWGAVYSAEAVVAHSRTRFVSTALPPFLVKGKIRPVAAVEVGNAIRTAPPRSATEQLPLIGRERELAVLRGSIADAIEGKGRLIELAGEAGNGKSRLLAEAALLGEGMRGVRGTCETYTQVIPYIGWREPLRMLLGVGWDDPDALVIERLRANLLQSHPELLPWLPLLAIAVGVEAPSTRQVDELSPDFRTARLHDVVLNFLEPELATPTLLLIEHAHLMDEASAALLDAFADRLQDTSWLVIVGRRDAVGGFVSKQNAAVRLDIGPLPPEATIALAESTPEAHLIPPHMLQLAVERSGGNAAFLLDLLAAAAGGSDVLPGSIEAAASARIDALDPGDRPLVRRAAVLGLRFRPAQLRHVLGPGMEDPDERTWKRLSSLFSADQDGYLFFKSPILCEAAYLGLPFRLRRTLHAAVAQALEPDLGRDVDADPAILSQHFSLAGDQTRAWTYALMGAERATARFAHADAARLYRRAIDAGRVAGATAEELANAWESLGEALRQTGERDAARKALTAARRLFEARPIDQARLLYRHAASAERSGGGLAAVRWANRGLRVLEGIEGEEAQRWRARLLSDLAGFRQRQGRTREAERICLQAIAEAEAIGELRALARACYVLDYVLVESGQPELATHSQRALDIYRELGDPEQESGVLNNLGMFAYWRGAWDEALEYYRRQAACSERSGNPANVAYTDCNVGEILSDQGHLEEATEHLLRARRVWSSTGDAPGVAFANVQLGRVAVRTGSYSDALSVLTVAADELRRFRLDGYADFASALVAEAEALGHDASRALELTERLLPSAERDVPLLRRVRGIALARLGAGDAATSELELSLLHATERSAHYDIAATLDAMSRIGGLDPQRARERDAILEQLHIVALPGPGVSREARRNVRDQHEVEAERA
jgi:class 3 adenylate cyclase/tetratricopeptide (TPR) repeat protein